MTAMPPGWGESIYVMSPYGMAWHGSTPYMDQCRSQWQGAGVPVDEIRPDQCTAHTHVQGSGNRHLASRLDPTSVLYRS